jgi:septal ring factor EnvC (AmiA/AmiB activator)
MSMIKKHFVIITLLMWLFIGSFLAAFEVIYVRSQYRELEVITKECGDKYRSSIRDLNEYKKKAEQELAARVKNNVELTNQHDLLMQEVQRLETDNADLNKQIESLRVELLGARAPKPTPKPVKKKRIPYDIAPSQQ